MANEFKSSCCTCEQYLSCTTCNKCVKCKVYKCLPKISFKFRHELINVYTYYLTAKIDYSCAKDDYDYKDYEYYGASLNYYLSWLKKLDLELKCAVMFISSNKKGSGANDET